MRDYTIDLNSGPGYLDPGLKFGWAKHHLRALEEELRVFLEGEPYTILFEDDLKAGQHIAHVGLSPPNVRLALIAGDFVSCLRASLDHLATFLTLAPGGTRNDRAAFPVIGINNSSTRRTFERDVMGIPADAVKIIESLQPYNSGSAYQSTKLWRLHRLWNIDKHRRIPLHANGADIPIRYPSNMEPVTSWTDDGYVLRFPLAAKGQLYFQPPVKVRIAFGDKNEGIAVSNDELAEIHEFIGKDVFPKFKDFF